MTKHSPRRKSASDLCTDCGRALSTDALFRCGRDRDGDWVEIQLCNGVRCGIGALFRPFVRVGDGARIGAGSVVVKNVPPGEVWVGNPARYLRDN